MYSPVDMQSTRSADGWEREDLAVLLPKMVANWTIEISGEKPITQEKQTDINHKLAMLWCKFLEENKEQWHSLGLTWESHFLTTRHLDKVHFTV